MSVMLSPLRDQKEGAREAERRHIVQAGQGRAGLARQNAAAHHIGSGVVDHQHVHVACAKEPVVGESVCVQIGVCMYMVGD